MAKGPPEHSAGEESTETIALWASILGSRLAAQAVFALGRELRTMTPPELEHVPYLGRVRAARVYAVVELSRRLMSLPLERGVAIQCPRDVFAALAPRMLDLGRESFEALYLDTKHRIITQETISLGSLASCEVDPKEILRTALKVRAVGVIVAHAHANSGDPAPSAEDRALTRRLEQAAKTVGIKFLDHIVIGTEGYYSFADHLELAS